MTLTLPEGAPPSTIEVTGSGLRRTVTVSHGTSQVLELPLGRKGAWTVQIRPRRPILLQDSRLVSVMASPPKVVAKP